MDLVKLKYGYRLTIGGHDMLLTKKDLTCLASLICLGESPSTMVCNISKDVVYVNQDFLLGIGIGETREIYIPLDKISQMHTAVFKFNKRFGRYISCKLFQKKAPEDYSQSRLYVLKRYK